MGIESYGLIGIFASLLALFALLDMGLSSTHPYAVRQKKKLAVYARS